jgi:uncharacterized protein YyaL (SSP411 family)
MWSELFQTRVGRLNWIVPNRLADATSPYLIQHAENPVDWFAWGDEAFALAKRLDKPVFVSIGYSSCHWCHVMAHESFEDEAVAELLNAEYVSVKVDREERPDVDDACMMAVQLMSGRGGWPMSIFMTPDRKPFLTGTYWPKDDRGGHPGFMSICKQVAEAWKTRRQAVEESAEQVASAIEQALTSPAPESNVTLDGAFLDQAVEALVAGYDEVNGGFGGAPKFPPHTAIEFLMRYAISPAKDEELQEAAISVALFTLRSMVLGGIHDHVGGGFHRYSTDERWLLPHFEKMLVDNALMLGNLAQAAGISSELEPALSELFARAAQSLIDWLMREMTSEEGLFFSAQDADSDGEEGKYYTWTTTEVSEILQHHAPVFMQAYGFEPEGNFEDEAQGRKTGANIPHLKEDLSAQFQQELEMLRLQRDLRVHPGLDDKALVGWNGLAIGALADSGMWPLAQNAVVGVLSAEKKHGRLPHQISKGAPTGIAYLDDYAYFIQGMLKLAVCLSFLEENGELPPQAIPSEALIAQAARLCSEMIEKFYDEENGGFFATSPEHEKLFGRSKPVFDQPAPSANAIAIRCLIQLGDEARARQSLNVLAGWMQRSPQATESLLTGALSLLAGYSDEMAGAVEVPIEIVSKTPVTPPKPKPEVVVSISGKEFVANSNSIGSGHISISVPEGYHLNSSKPPARWLVPTKVEIRGLKAEVKYPEAIDDQYRGQIVLPFEVQLPNGESGAEFELTVSYQACTDSECLAPSEKVFTAVVVRG